MDKNEEIISFVINKWANWYKENEGMDACDINTGECMNFAESVYEELLDDYGIKTEILSDAFFYDPFDDIEPEELLEPSEYGGTPTYDYKKIGFPSHYWIYYNGKNYDSEVPSGIKNFFELPTVINFAKKYKALNEVRKLVKKTLYEIFEIGELKTPAEIMSYINNLHKKGYDKKHFEDKEWVYSLSNYKLQDVNLSDLKISAIHPPLYINYSKLSSELPPIVVDSTSGYILDGNHRAKAAELRGEKTIKAFVGYK